MHIILPSNWLVSLIRSLPCGSTPQLQKQTIIIDMLFVIGKKYSFLFNFSNNERSINGKKKNEKRRNHNL